MAAGRIRNALAPSDQRRVMARISAALILFALVVVYLDACASRPPPAPPPPPSPVVEAQPTPQRQRFMATAYSIEGRTASGRKAKPGVVAADPKVLPIGSRIRISDAGQYSGVYTVADTGRAIKGHELDIYIANDAEARRFGRRAVQVEVMQGAADSPR